MLVKCFRTKNIPTSPLKTPLEKRPSGSVHQKRTLENIVLINVKNSFQKKTLSKCSSILYRTKVLPKRPPKFLYQRRTVWKLSWKVHKSAAQNTVENPPSKNDRNKTLIKNVSKKNAARNTAIYCCRSKKFNEMLVKKVPIKNTSQNTANFSLKIRQYRSSRQIEVPVRRNTVQSCLPEHWQKLSPGKRVCWNAPHEFFVQNSSPRHQKISH